MRRGAWFPALLVVALASVLVFLGLPVAAIFLDTSPGELIASLGEPEAQDALLLSLKTTSASLALIVLVGTPAAYLLATRNFRGKAAVVTLVELPLVLPPAVAGIALLASVGPAGLLGPITGDSLALQTAGVVVALAFVASPFYIRQAQSAFAALNPTWLDAARTLGASEAGAFARVAVPAALPGLGAGGRTGPGPRAGRVRRHPHLRRLVPGHHPDRPAGDLRPLRHRLRRIAGARRGVGAGLGGAVALRQADRAQRHRPLLELAAPHAGRGARPGPGAERARRALPGAGRAVRGGQDQRAAGGGRVAPSRRAAAPRAPSEVWLDTGAGVDLPPEERRCGYVFQDYALFEHLSAWRNVAFSSRAARRAPRAGRSSCSSASASATGPRRRRASCPEASASGSRWRGRWPAAPTRCCSTSRSRRWTRAPAPRPPASWARSWPTRRSPRCW